MGKIDAAKKKAKSKLRATKKQSKILQKSLAGIVKAANAKKASKDQKKKKKDVKKFAKAKAAEKKAVFKQNGQAEKEEGQKEGTGECCQAKGNFEEAESSKKQIKS